MKFSKNSAGIALNRSQLRSISGGSVEDPGGCSTTCPAGSKHTSVSFDTCSGTCSTTPGVKVTCGSEEKKCND